jgi:hypothetical protein
MTTNSNQRAPLENMEEKLYRQVHPNFFQAGRVTSQAFRPTAKDQGMLSVSRGSMTNPRQAMTLARQRGVRTLGTWSVTVGNAADLELPAYPDPVTDGVPDEAHALIDFSRLSNGEARLCSERLRTVAVCEVMDTEAAGS